MVYGWLLLLPAIVLLAAFTYYPALATIWHSLYSTPRGGHPAHFAGLAKIDMRTGEKTLLYQGRAGGNGAVLATAGGIVFWGDIAQVLRAFDAETGKVTLLRHVTADDAGPVLNPLLFEGQRHGGIAQGAAQALVEEILYDADGNPLTATLMDYGAITAAELPSFELLTSETPTTVNPLGVKGIGEAGTIGATPAVHNAVIDAVKHLGVRHIDMPMTPERVWTAIQKASAQKESAQ